MPTTQVHAIWLRILALLSIVFLSCALKNYLVYLISGTGLCPYLCPSTLGAEAFVSYPFIEKFFSAQVWVQNRLQMLTGMLVRDRHELATALILAPLLEESVYRGPMFLSRNMTNRPLWWTTGLLLSVLFALSHGRAGLALLPLIVLGICSLWLIAKTHRFWPSIGLHVLYNFFYTSVIVVQWIWIGD